MEKSLLAKIVKVLRSLQLAYVELREKFEQPQKDYGRVRESNTRLSDRLQEVKLENKALRQISADYERVKRVFGSELVKAAVLADKQREQAEKVFSIKHKCFSWFIIVIPGEVVIKAGKPKGACPPPLILGRGQKLALN